MFQHKVSKPWRQTVHRNCKLSHDSIWATFVLGSFLSTFSSSSTSLYIPHYMITIKSTSPDWDPFRSPNYYIQLSSEYFCLNVFHINSKYPKLGCSSSLPNCSFSFLPYFSGGHPIYIQSPTIWSPDTQFWHIPLMDAL